jgi:SAM-dependent methyltransferase
MRLAELDRDMSAVFPIGVERDSEFLYARMREVTYEELRAGPGDRVLDAAAGIGEDGQRLAERGLRVTSAEPSQRISDLGQLIADQRGWKDYGSQLTDVRAWAEALPFRDGAFQAAFCKGSLDHFDDPVAGVRDMARVTCADGRVVLSVVNMDALGCRVMAWRDRWGRQHRRRRERLGRRHYDAPPDHYTRYDRAALRDHAEQCFHVESVRGVSLMWGIGWWTRLTNWLSERNALRLLRTADRIADWFPSLADVIVIAGSPRQAG